MTSINNQYVEDLLLVTNGEICDPFVDIDMMAKENPCGEKKSRSSKKTPKKPSKRNDMKGKDDKGNLHRSPSKLERLEEISKSRAAQLSIMMEMNPNSPFAERNPDGIQLRRSRFWSSPSKLIGRPSMLTPEKEKAQKKSLSKDKPRCVDESPRKRTLSWNKNKRNKSESESRDGPNSRRGEDDHDLLGLDEFEEAIEG